jgi:hypothetical protein
MALEVSIGMDGVCDKEKQKRPSLASKISCTRRVISYAVEKTTLV